MELSLITGEAFKDSRGSLVYNNSFDASEVKRIYLISDMPVGVPRGCQGHQIERRWFFASKGKLRIDVVKINNWNEPESDYDFHSIEINAEKLDILAVPKDCCNKITALQDESILTVMSDYLLGEVEDEHRFPIEYFNKKN